MNTNGDMYQGLFYGVIIGLFIAFITIKKYYDE